MLNKHISVNLMSNIYCNYFNTLKYVLLLPQPQPHPLRDGLQLSLWPRKVDVIITAPGLERQWRTHHVSVESKSELFIIYLLPKMMCVQNTSLREGINNGWWKLLYKKEKKDLIPVQMNLALKLLYVYWQGPFCRDVSPLRTSVLFSSGRRTLFSFGKLRTAQQRAITFGTDDSVLTQL